MNNILKIVIAVNLIVITVLVFIYPQLMIAPGKLIASHKQLETDCFACHAPLSGVASERCITCHKTADIGRLLTTGQTIAKPRISTPFHQELNSQDCVACAVGSSDVHFDLDASANVVAPTYAPSFRSNTFAAFAARAPPYSA